MRKIKKFKINFRHRDILRVLKAATKLEITAQIEEAVQREARRAQDLTEPAAEYETLAAEKLPMELAAGAPDRWIAASVYLATIGPGMENEIKEVRGRGEEILAQVLHAVALEGLDQTINFAQRLMADEAKDDGCELTGDVTVTDPGMLAKVFEIISPDKLCIERQGDAALKPLYSGAGIVYWVPQKKRSAKTAR